MRSRRAVSHPQTRVREENPSRLRRTNAPQRRVSSPLRTLSRLAMSAAVAFCVASRSDAADEQTSATPATADLEQKLQTLRQRYKDSHPEVVDILRRLDAHKPQSEPKSTIPAQVGPDTRDASTPAPESERNLNERLLAMPPNQWTLFHKATGKWRRSNHAGSVFDSRRGNLVVFGSDTHGRNWDNAVHIFDPYQERWSSNSTYSNPNTYRVNANGYAVAGDGEERPWAMHTYDTLVYDPQGDALFVMATPNHNPIRKKIKKRRNPTWTFHLATQRWRIHEPIGKKRPLVFAGASAYDSHRDVIVAYSGARGGGIWELGPNRKQWRRVAGAKHQIHFTMEYDPHRRKLVVFGDHAGSRDVWEYTPGNETPESKRWRKRMPSGDCPALESAPVAYDTRHRVFLTLSRDKATCVYDANANRFDRLPVKTPKVGKLNYMLVYDTFHEVFLLVTGSHMAPPEVWAFRYSREDA